MLPSDAARLRLFAFCIAVCARSAAFVAVTILALKLLLNPNRIYCDYRPEVLAAWLGLSAIPALILTPLIGPLAASRWNRVVLIGCSALLVGMLIWTTAESNVPWLSVVGVLSLEAAFFGPALLASVTPMSRAVGMRGPVAFVYLSLSAVVGVSITVATLRISWFFSPELALVAAIISLIAVLFVKIPIAEPLSLAKGLIRPFIMGSRDAVRRRQACFALFGILIWSFVTLTVVVALLRIETLAAYLRKEAILAARDLHDMTGHIDEWIFVETWRFVTWLLLGVLLSALNRNPFRHAGFIPLAAVGAAIACVWLRFGSSWDAPMLILGASLGAALSPLLNCYFLWTTPKCHGIAAALLVAGCCVGALLLAAIMLYLGDDPVAARGPILNILLAVTSIATIGAFVAYSRPALEGAAEPFLRCLYKVRMVGPGVEHLPTRGPCLVIGNHAAWFDPLFIAKDLPMPVTPMMTSKFYDLPVLSWIMRNIIGTIRVPESPLRHEAPELKEAVAALDRGACIVLFPEGYLRRKEEQPLRRFGRGVWKILADRPDTPVFACWIEGNWGSYFSYKDGPPTKNKRFDFRRLIRIGMIGPIKVDPTILADHMTTRTYLMRQVAAAREPLGLEPLDLQYQPEGDKE